MADSSDTFKTMCMGIAIFVGGMIAVVLLMKYFNQPAPAQARAETPAPMLPLSVSTPSIRQLEKINDSINLQIPKGTFENRTIVVDDTITLIDKKEEGGLNWSSVDITNLGAGGVYFGVNKWDSPEAPLPPGQTINIDMKRRGAIDKLYLKAETGTTATINLYIIK